MNGWNNRRILVTGANGFVGSRLCEHLLECGYTIRATVRGLRSGLQSSDQLEIITVPDLLHFAEWPTLLRDIDAVVHLVARTHVTDEFGMAAMQEYRRTNVDLTRRIAKAANREGVSRFVYLSSIKAVGNGSSETYTEQTNCHPEDSYGKSKLEAELALRTVLTSDCDYTILRPPLVYGPQVQGNFLRLLQLVQRGIPLPSVDNARSMVHVDNLVDAIELSIRSPKAGNQTFHCADPEPISTADLIRSMAEGLDCACRLLPMPEFLLRGLGQLVGKTEEIKRLVGSLTVSNEALVTQLDWQPKFTTVKGVVQTSSQFRRIPWPLKTKPRQAASKEVAHGVRTDTTAPHQEAVHGKTIRRKAA